VSKKIYLPIIALAIGFANAYVAFQVHSMLFCLLPLWAFLLGYFSSWKTGLLSSFLLFISYTTVTAFMSYPISSFDPNGFLDYLFNFVWGGFILCIIGCGAPLVRRGLRNFKSIGVLVLLALLLVWCGFVSFPGYSYCYQVIIESSKNLDDLELYLPLVTVAQEPYAEIFNYPHHPFLGDEGSFKGGLLEDYSLEITDTEYGKMLKFGVPGLEAKYKPSEETVKLGPEPPTPVDMTPGPEPYPYVGSIIFDMLHTSHEELQFMPKYDVQEVIVIYSERFLGTMRVEARELVQEFRVPIKVSSDTEAEIKIYLECWYVCGGGINFTNGKGEVYSETVKLVTTTSNEWTLVAGEAVSSFGVGQRVD
jgi:hypothetical protein